MVKYFIIALACFAGIVKGQNTFEKIYTIGGSLKLVESEGGQVIAGLGGQGVSIVSSTGDLLQTLGYQLSPLFAPMAFDQYTDSTVVFVTGIIDGNCGAYPIIHPVICEIKLNGDVLATYYYDLNVGCQNLTRGMIVTQNKDILTWGLQPGFFALRADSSFLHVWSRSFDRAGSFQFIKELPCGDLLAGINMDTAGAVVARMTAAGEFLWCRSYVRPSGLVHDCLVESDSSFLVIGVTDDVASASQQEFMLKLNGAGDVQWCRGYGNGQGWAALAPSRIVPAPDGQRLVLATGFANGPRPLLMKVDQNGDTLWTRAAGVDGYNYETADLIIHSDGSVLYSGLVNGDLPGLYTGLPFLYKADSLGHLPCSERQPPPIVITNLFPTDSSFVLSSVDGAVGHAVTVSDTTFAPFVVYDGCVITSAPLAQRAYERIRIRPNPTTGRFSMSFPHPLQAESFYSVYDVSGKLLYQRPLASGSSAEEVDLSRYGKGTYVIRFTSPAEVCFERVVVE